MREGIDATTLALWLSGRFTLHTRIRVANGSGTLVNLHGRIGGYTQNWPNPNTPIASLEVEFLREITNLDALTPSATASTLNRLDDGVTYSPLLQIGRRVVRDVALTPKGGARPADGASTWYETFRGIITTIRWPGRFSRTASISCLDMAGVLKKNKSQVAYTYAAGTAYETVAQQILTNNGHTDVVLTVPVATGKVLEKAYAPGRQRPVWDQLWDLAQSMGWLIWFRYTGTSTLELTLFEPPRTKSVPDLTVPRVDEYTDLGMDDEELGNVLYGSFINSSGERQEVDPVIDPASIATYGGEDGIERPFWIVLDEGSPVRTEDDMLLLLAAALSDVADPDVIGAAQVPPWVFGDSGQDLYTFSADGRCMPVTQNLAPFAISQSERVDEEPSSTLQVRGAPSAGARTWKGLAGGAGIGPTLDVVSSPGISEYVITWSGDNVLLSVDGGAFATPPASPISVDRTPADHTYVFRASKDGQIVTSSVTIPASAASITEAYLPLAGGDMLGDVNFGAHVLSNVVLRSVRTRELWVDANGRGDHTTLAAAVSAAVAGGAGATTPYLIHIVGTGSTGYNIGVQDIPTGVHLRAAGAFETRLYGQLTVHPWTSFAHLRIEPTDPAHLVAVSAVADGSGGTIEFFDCNIFVNKTVDNVIEAFHLAGTASAVLLVRNCYVYCNNSLSGAFTSAEIIVYRVASGTPNAHIEIRGGHTKTSVPGNASIPVVYGYAQGTTRNSGILASATDWECFHSPAPVLYVNENPDWEGGTLDVAVTHVEVDGAASFSSSGTNPARLFTSRILNRLDVRGSLSMGGTQVLSAAGALTNVTANASILTAGTLGVPRGGTGLGTVAAGSLLYASATDVLAARAIGSTNQVLKVAGAMPTWGSVAFSELTGSLAYTQLPTGSIPWDTGAGTTLTITRALAVSGLLTAAGGVKVTGGTFATNFGGMFKSASNGLAVVGVPGSSYDIFWYSADGNSALLGNPTGTKHLNLALSSGACVGIGTGGYSSGVTLNVTGDVHSTGYLRAATGIRLTGNSNEFLPGASDRSSFKSASTTGALLGIYTSDNLLRGMFGYGGGNFGMFGADTADGVSVASDRVRLHRTSYERFSGADYLVAKVIVSTVAPTGSDAAPDGTLWCQV